VNPFLLVDGGLPDDAVRGRGIFERANVGCSFCHLGARLTDSRFIDAGVPLLHDVGTLTPGSGQRLGMTLEGLDTPTLRGLWRTPPFLHDGSARTIGDVLRAQNPLNRHGRTLTLTPNEQADLEAYLRCL
jgi:cytochrome c peroxidase